jgi:hypothetical protein
MGGEDLGLAAALTGCFSEIRGDQLKAYRPGSLSFQNQYSPMRNELISAKTKPSLSKKWQKSAFSQMNILISDVTHHHTFFASINVSSAGSQKATMELADSTKKLRPVLVLCTSCKLRFSTQTLGGPSMYIASLLSWSKVGVGRSMDEDIVVRRGTIDACPRHPYSSSRGDIAVLLVC